MRKHISLFALLFSMTTLCYGEEKVTLAADVWYPMNGDPNAEHPGYMIEIAKLALAPNYTVEYQNMPWKRALDEARRGNVNCAVGAYKEDAPDFVFPEESFGIDESWFYTKANKTWEYKNIESLKSVRLAVIGGYGYTEPLNSYIADSKNASMIDTINADNGLEPNIKKLMAGRVDVIVESKLVMEAKLAQLGLSDAIRPAGALGNKSEMYIACSPKLSNSTEITKRLAAGIQSLRSSGKLKEILATYGIEDWKN